MNKIQKLLLAATISAVSGVATAAPINPECASTFQSGATLPVTLDRALASGNPVNFFNTLIQNSNLYDRDLGVEFGVVENQSIPLGVTIGDTRASVENTLSAFAAFQSEGSLVCEDNGTSCTYKAIDASDNLCVGKVTVFYDNESGNAQFNDRVSKITWSFPQWKTSEDVSIATLRENPLEDLQEIYPESTKRASRNTVFTETLTASSSAEGIELAIVQTSFLTRPIRTLFTWEGTLTKVEKPGRPLLVLPEPAPITEGVVIEGESLPIGISLSDTRQDVEQVIASISEFSDPNTNGCRPNGIRCTYTAHDVDTGLELGTVMVRYARNPDGASPDDQVTQLSWTFDEWETSEGLSLADLPRTPGENLEALYPSARVVVQQVNNPINFRGPITELEDGTSELRPLFLRNDSAVIRSRSRGLRMSFNINGRTGAANVLGTLFAPR